ncbi:hypothetical protein L917_00861 [Phytophthora nicotianae]|uniref:Uncharacterized protein n=1 Tax=Phytophthora nicotianae TaxID=4792 RepID=W2M1A5_PHYNI|nr:hypothetical protein L917_00861 [Phytophthora nicotianae]
MDTVEYPWGNQNNLVSSLDLLEEEALREANKHGPHWNRDKHLLVEGEPAATVPREVSRISPRKPHMVAKTSTRRRLSKRRGRNRSTNNAEEEEESRRQLQLENERLQQEIAQWKREVAHARDEKLELEASFRRLDQEIGNGYHLTERKEKELRIAELVTKNQKMSQLLEKELQSQEELRRAHTELQGEHRKLTEQVTLLNQVLDSVEAKHSELSNSHKTLTASYEAAQKTIETLQKEILVLQDKLSTTDAHVQLITEYEGKIQQWERTCRELEQKCENKNQKLKQLQKITSATQQEAQLALDRQEELEQELRNAHDQVIQTNAAIRTMEAKLEASLKAGGSQDSLRRIRQLEGELLHMNRANAELMQTCNQLLSSQKQSGSGRISLTTRNGQTMASQVAKLTTRITSLTDKLRATEEARDQKGRSLDILMQAFPFLLRRLDAMQDQLAAAVESNDILHKALEMKDTGTVNNETGLSGAMYLHLARDKYLLEAPYPLELLADQTGAKVLSGYPEPTTRAKAKKFSPFRVTCSALKPKDNQREEGSENQADQLVTLIASSNDTSGASYLSRSKTNAFLEVIQCSAARKKFKTLVIGKLAEYMNKLRELAHRSASEAAAQQASIQMLRREVVELQHRLKNAHSDNNNIDQGAMTKKDSYRTRQFLLKIVDVYADKQLENDHRQMTFVTQPMSSDMLITNTHNENYRTSDDRLLLSESDLSDDEVGQLLLKISVSGVRFREINFDSNNLSDLGAQYVADFVEKSYVNVRIVSLAGNKRITHRGIELIRGGLLRNQRVQRVCEDENVLNGGINLRGLAIGADFDVSGNATEILRVILPIVPETEESEGELKTTTPEAVDAMMEKLRQLGVFTSTIRSLRQYEAHRAPFSKLINQQESSGSYQRQH